MKKLLYILVIAALFGCKNEKDSKDENRKLQVVTTTTMITDLVSNIGGDLIDVEGLMGAGVDPHLYKASAGDVSKLANADIIFYNGLEWISSPILYISWGNYICMPRITKIRRRSSKFCI